MSKPQRGSTIALYQSKWSVYQDWCGKNRVHPVFPTIPQLTNFFYHLFSDKKFAVTSIKGYKAAIATTLKATGSWNDRWEDDCIALFKSMLLQRPRSLQVTPKWDLSIVLHSLMKHPYEPMAHCDLKRLTLKTVFLLAVATAQRRSELHALSLKKVLFSEAGASLGTMPNFMAKNQRQSTTSPPVVIPSLSRTVSGDLPDRTLCPVRALKFYIDRTKSPSFRQGRERLFVSYKEGHTGDIAAATISRWIVETIRTSYCLVRDSSDLRRLHSITAHEVRALATSWSQYRGVALAEVLAAGRWKHASTFSSFYLRDCTSLVDGMQQIGPIVAAQHVI